MTSDICLGDVIRAWRELGATTEEERGAIARVLGFELREHRALKDESGNVIITATGTAIGTATATGQVEVRSEDPGQISVLELTPFKDLHPNSMALPTELAEPTAGTPLPLEPLFVPGWSRAIASSLVARPANAGALYIDRAVDMIARRTHLRVFPRRKRLVSASEVAVVIDRRGSLPWFREDAMELVRRLDVVTRAPVRRMESDGAPVLALATEAREVAYRAANDHGERLLLHVRVGAFGRVIAISDLGLMGVAWGSGEPSRAQAWIDFAIALRGRQATLAVVTPVPAEQIPPELARVAACVYWDSSTRPALVHRSVKEQR